MKNFKKAFENLISFEGHYSNNPKDTGGETFAGISRKFNGSWNGWKIIDNIKASSTTINEAKETMKNSKELHEAVVEFYYNNYWLKFKGDKLPFPIAEELFEQSVVLGTWKTAGKNLQKTANLLNRNGKLFPDLVVDGFVGNKTITVISKLNVRRVVIVLNGLEFCRFKSSMENKPTNEVFVGWFNRCAL